MATNFEPHECVIFVQTTKIGTHEKKAIHNIKDLVYRKNDSLLFILFVWLKGSRSLIDDLC